MPGFRLNRVHHAKLCYLKKPHSFSVIFIFLSELIREVYMFVFAVRVYKILVMLHAMKRRAVETTVKTHSRRIHPLERCVLRTFNEQQ